MDMPENNCPELIEKTAAVIDNASLRELFVSTQKNNLDLCGKDAVKCVSHSNNFNFKNVDNLKTCLEITNWHLIGSSICGSSQQISTLLGMFYK